MGNSVSLKSRLVAFAVAAVVAFASLAAVSAEKAYAGTDLVSYVAQSVKVKASYTQTFKIDKDKATFKTSTKKVLRKVDGENIYSAKLTKYVGKTKGDYAEVPGVVIYTDERFDLGDEGWPTANVTAIAPKAFASCTYTKLQIDSLRLTKAGVKNSLVGSKITKVVVPKSCLKTYKKYFSKSNCGKSVKVVAFSGKFKNYPKGDWIPSYATVIDIDI